ncbi:hypothetical protein F2Q69_00031279 [Brassica cretica]|uniref:Uncharacterized protein n=1 Tax=Brassica cretica TaxID=69181 RepID=A0A8S9RQH7_BRACR|nr:hypothetical protein F2Q69_00031279 [Brassica cretica]
MSDAPSLAETIHGAVLVFWNPNPNQQDFIAKFKSSERSWCKDLIPKNPKLFLLAFQQPLPSQPDTILAQTISYILSLHPGRPQLHIRHHRQLASRPILRPDKGASSRLCATRGSSDFGGPVQPYKIKVIRNLKTRIEFGCFVKFETLKDNL